ncbi:hypothetical protein G7Y89_g725 [Cudoniella acicularis]|uniref:Uncharacterized protein n=1 Tax=Cudoniella acicularis TaxID=354080 RepID=A0A8H4RYM7_9HELO|nr:hypothetical protein G7Y89_g725 [Cudoniella acicularis]
MKPTYTEEDIQRALNAIENSMSQKKAGLNALTARNIKSGWQAVGLWPTNSIKPLINRLLLENSNNLEKESKKRKAEEPLPDWNTDQSAFKVPTPKKLEDIREQVYSISRLGKATTPTARVLFRKVSKAIDQKNFVIAQHKRRIQQLEARVQQLEPRKRRKVKTSPNSKFAGIEAIKKAQIEAGNRQIEEEDSDRTIQLISTNDVLAVVFGITTSVLAIGDQNANQDQELRLLSSTASTSNALNESHPEERPIETRNQLQHIIGDTLDVFSRHLQQ